MPSITHAAHEQLLALIEGFEQQHIDDDALAFLRRLATDIPRMREVLPDPVKHALQELDANETALAYAIHAAASTIGEYQRMCADPLPIASMLDAAALAAVAEAGRALAQAGSEVALRAQARIELLEAST